MKSIIRTVLAYLIAPWSTPVVGAIVGAWISGRRIALPTLGEFPHRADDLVSLAYVYAVAWVPGTIAFVVLWRLRRESAIMYAGCAALAGAIYGFVVATGESPMAHAYLATSLALLSVPTGLVFHLIRGGRRAANQSVETTRGT